MFSRYYKRFDMWQIIQRSPCRFSDTISSKDLRLNEIDLMYIVYLDGSTVLCVVEKRTMLATASIINNILSIVTWDAVIKHLGYVTLFD